MRMAIGDETSHGPFNGPEQENRRNHCYRYQCNEFLIQWDGSLSFNLRPVWLSYSRSCACRRWNKYAITSSCSFRGSAASFSLISPTLINPKLRAFKARCKPD